MKYKIVRLFDNDKKLKLQEIADTCNDYDTVPSSFFVEDEVEFLCGLPFAYCAQIENKTVGFISLYGIDQSAIEICGFVLPEYRLKGIMASLLVELKSDCKDISITVPISYDGFDNVASKFKMKYSDTELGMSFNLCNYLKRDTFIESKVTSDDDSYLYDFYKKDKLIGNCTISIFDNNACISDVKIKKEYRGLGLGTPLINCVLNNLHDLNLSKLMLHVTKSNEPAYRLYKSCGFTVDSCVRIYLAN